MSVKFHVAVAIATFVLLGDVSMGLLLQSPPATETESLQTEAADDASEKAEAADVAVAEVELPDLSEVIRKNGGLGLSNYSEKTQEVLTRGALMTFDNWLKSGTENERALKDYFSKSEATKQVVTTRCAGDEECKWKQRDALLCESLESAVLEGKLVNVSKLEKIIKSTVVSSWMYGVDYNSRAAMIAKWQDPEFPVIFLGDQADEFNQMKFKIMQMPKFQKLVNLTCEGLDKARPGCRRFAPRALFCQALAGAAAAATGAKEVVSRLEDFVVRRSDAKDIRTSKNFANMSQLAQNIISDATELTVEKWLQSGTPAVRSLKVKFIMSAPVKDTVTKKCSDLFGECALKENDHMLCSWLQGLGGDVATERIQQLTMQAFDHPEGIDWPLRRAFVAKFSEFRAPTEAEKLNEKMASMKMEALKHTSLKGMVNRTCKDISHFRPACRGTTPTSLFCQGLARTLADELGPDEVMTRIYLAHFGAEEDEAVHIEDKLEDADPRPVEARADENAGLEDADPQPEEVRADSKGISSEAPTDAEDSDPELEGTPADAEDADHVAE